MAQGRVDQITVARALTDHDQRIQRLERNPVAAAGALAPATIARIIAECAGFTVPPTIGGAGMGGTDWIPVPVYFIDDDLGDGVGNTNAWNNDPDSGFGVNDTHADLYEAGFRIFSTHYPLADWGFDGSELVSSIRVDNTWNGQVGAVYESRLRVAATSDNGTTTAPAEQTLGFMLAGFGARFAGSLWGGSMSWSGSNLLTKPASATDLIQVPGGAANPAFEMTCWTDPGDPLWNIGQITPADLVAQWSVYEEFDFSDIVIFACNPGPKDQTVDISIETELKNQSGAFGEGG